VTLLEAYWFPTSSPVVAPIHIVLQSVSHLSLQAGVIWLQSESSTWKGVHTVCFRYLRWVLWQMARLVFGMIGY